MSAPGRACAVAIAVSIAATAPAMRAASASTASAEDAAPASAPEVPLALEAAYDRALETDQSIRTAYEEVEKADLLTWSALTRMAPTVTASGSYLRPEHAIRDSQGPVLVETRSAQVAVEQPLFDLSTVPAYQAGSRAAAEARLRHRQTVRDVLFGVARAFFEVLKDERVVDVNGQILDLARGQLTLAERRFSVGEVTKTDVARARVAVEQAHQKQIEAENSLRLAQHTLASILNLDPAAEPKLAEPSPQDHQIPAIDDAEHSATLHRDDLAASKLAIEESEATHREVLARYAPKVVGDWTDQWLDPETFSSRNDFWTATVGVTLPLFDGGQREIDVARTDHDIREARLAHETLAKSVDLEVRDAWLEVRTLEETLEALRAQLAAAEETYRDLESQYRAGEATSLDLQSALTDLGTARTDLASRTFDLEIALLELQRAMGTFQDARAERVKLE